MKKDEITVECEGNPLMEKILQSAIKKKRGHRSFLPHKLPDEVFDQLVAFSYKYFENDTEREEGDVLYYQAIFLCVTQIFDYQQNPHEHGDVRVHKDKIYDAIGMYCMWLQFELVTRTKSLDIVVSPPTLYGIFDEKRGFKIEISPSQSLNFPEGIKNLSPNAFSGIKDLIGEGRALNSLGDDATMH